MDSLHAHRLLCGTRSKRSRQSAKNREREKSQGNGQASKGSQRLYLLSLSSAPLHTCYLRKSSEKIFLTKTSALEAGQVASFLVTLWKPTNRARSSQLRWFASSKNTTLMELIWVSTYNRPVISDKIDIERMLFVLFTSRLGISWCTGRSR
jgi:hypothetical protein